MSMNITSVAHSNWNTFYFPDECSCEMVNVTFLQYGCFSTTCGICMIHSHSLFFKPCKVCCVDFGVFMSLKTIRYELDLWDLALSKPAGALLQQRFCFLEAVRWAWEGRGSPLRDASHRWDCRCWCSPVDIINSGYCWDVFFKPYAVQKQWAAVEARCVTPTSCSCIRKICSKSMNWFGACIPLSQQDGCCAAHVAVLLVMYKKALCVFVRLRLCLPATFKKENKDSNCVEFQISSDTVQRAGVSGPRAHN